MNLKLILPLILLASSPLLAPLFQPSNEYDILPNEVQEDGMFIRSNSIVLISESNTPISINLTYIAPTTENVIILVNEIVTTQLDIDLEETGAYQISMVADQLSKLLIDFTGIPQPITVYLLLLTVISLVIFGKYLYDLFTEPI